MIELRELARAPEDATTFDLACEGVTFRVVYSGGSSSSLTLSASYDAVAKAGVAEGGREAHYRVSAKGGVLAAIRPMSIKLRRESSTDRAAKSEGINREHQTGDAAFDEDVYVDSPTIDATVLQTVLSERVRAGAMELLSLAFDSISIDDGDGRVTAVLSAFMKLRDVPARASRVAHAFASLLSGLPPVRHSGGAHPPRSALPKVMAVLGFVLLIASPALLFVIAGAHDCTQPASDGDGQSLKDGCGGPAQAAFVVAAVVGSIAAIVARAIARPRLAGHSDSRARILMVVAAAFTWIGVATFLAMAAMFYAGLKR